MPDVTSVEILISTVAAAIAAGAAVVAVGLALRTLREARATTQAQLDTVNATRALTVRTEASVRALHLILVEGQAARELSHLQALAEPLGRVTLVRRRIRRWSSSQPAPWHDLQDAQNHLLAVLAALPDDSLPKCHAMTAPDPRGSEDSLDIQAAQELSQAVAEARRRLAEIAAKASAELAQELPRKQGEQADQ